MEAACRNGSLATARAAQRLGRFTMGAPGPVTSALSAGVHELLRTEATLVTDATEVIELVGEMGDLAPTRGARFSPVTCWNRPPGPSSPPCPATAPHPPRRSRSAPAPHATRRSRDCTNSAHLAASNDTAMAGS